MPAEHRKVEIAVGHIVTVRRAPRQSGMPGKVTVVKSHRAPFDVDASRWDRAEVVR